MKTIHAIANDLHLEVMKLALQREREGELVIDRDSYGSHRRYFVTEKGRWVKGIIAEEEEAR